MKHPSISNKGYEMVHDIMSSGEMSGYRGTPEGRYGFGKYTKRLENSFKAYFSVKYAVAINSATSALHASLVACDIGVGDEVIVTPYSFSSSASCVLMVGATPVFVDIEPNTFCLNPIEIWKALTPKTKAIIPVHLCGHPADMTYMMNIVSHKVAIIEDAAQAIGAEWKGRKVGTIGDCGVFSFNQSKHISTGEGGMLITDDETIYERACAVRNHGEVSFPALKIVGYNYRMCEIEAALALDQFHDLDQMTRIRIGLAEYMSQRLSEIDGFTPPITLPDCKHVFYTYAVKYDEAKVGMPRNEFQKKMIDKGVYFGSGYVEPLYLLPVYEKFGYKKGLCPVTERMWERELLVFDWLRYGTTFKDIDHAIKIVKEVIHG